jgi:hypothetical protein
MRKIYNTYPSLRLAISPWDECVPGVAHLISSTAVRSNRLFPQMFWFTYYTSSRHGIVWMNVRLELTIPSRSITVTNQNLNY